MLKNKVLSFVCLALVGLFFTAQANFYPERYYEQRTKTKLNLGWKFAQDNPDNPLTGDPSTITYDDASWKTVNIPHSASYDNPSTKTSEDASFKGVCWYRLKFTIPSTAKNTGKFFIEFEGAMQTADVWINGVKIGTHNSSGYTGFSFDITPRILSLTGTYVLAVKLDNTYQTSIPPGCPGDGGGTGPDYYLFSGLYRDVWLVCTDKSYIPLYGQKISVSDGPYTSGAPVTIKTTVQNDNATAKTIKLRYVIAFDERESNSGLVVDSSEQTLNAGQSVNISKVVGPIDNPHLWSLNDPYLYRVFTQVFADGVLVDDFVERFGVRWFTWTSADKFKLNGESVYLQGNSLHQMFPWIQNAANANRFYRDIKLAKDMGVNMVRCAHYPRSPSYYNILDELGMLCFVEVPTWGNNKGQGYYPADFWTHLDTCMSEMIRVGQNHPSIIAWGLFNEIAGDFVTEITAINNIAHTMDSTRLTYMANNNFGLTVSKIPDVFGLNYCTPACITFSPKPSRLINTEYHVGWTGDYAFRGDNNDKSTGVAANFWTSWTNDCVAEPLLAGGTVWCHADYNSPMNLYPMGVVDCYRIPKSTYYLYRKNWLNVPDDNPVSGLTATHIVLESDTNTLAADSVDCAFLYASIRDANGVCVHTGYGTSCNTNVTFSVTGPATWFGATTVKANGGKCALLIKSKNTTGTIRVIATSAGLTPDTVFINSIIPDNSPLHFITPVLSRQVILEKKMPKISAQKGFIRVQFSSKEQISKLLTLYNIRGQKIQCQYQINNLVATFNTKNLTAGYYFVSVGKNSGIPLKKILIIN